MKIHSKNIRLNCFFRKICILMEAFSSRNSLDNLTNNNNINEKNLLKLSKINFNKNEPQESSLIHKQENLKKIDENKKALKKNISQIEFKKKKDNFDFLTFSIKNQYQLDILKECVDIYEKITESNFYSPSEFYLYYKENINKINFDKKLNSKDKINKLIEMWNQLNNADKRRFVEQANEISYLLMRKKFDMENSFFIAVRYEIISEKLILKIKNDFLNKKCISCWLIHKFCICNKIKKIDFKSNLYIVIHNKEFLRASNTSKILNLSKMPDSDLKLNFIIVGFWEHEKKLEKLFKDKNFIENSIILYPDKNSISSAEFLECNLIKFNNDKEKLNIYINNLNIFILDGTWSQTSNLKKLLDEILLNKEKNIDNIKTETDEAFLESDDEELNKNKVSNNLLNTNFNEEVKKTDGNKTGIKIEKCKNICLNSYEKITSVSIKFDYENKKNIFENLRKSHSEEKCSTIEALAILLTDLGYDKKIYETVLDNMRVFVKDLCFQNRKKLES